MQFTIEEKIQESNFTNVYRAYDAVLQRRVLLKVLHKHHAADPDLHRRFMREAQACAALRSEHIVQVYELTEYEGSPAIVMEYVEGTSLKKLISDGKTQSLKYAQKVALHTLRGLVTAHERGIIHRDIKPGNILAAEDGTFKVSDFGLAYIAFVPTVTSQGMVLGTPAYMSPEQIRHEEVDSRTDLFSLGATLVEVLTGHRLFEGNSYAECAKKILTFKMDMLDQYAGQSSPEFTQFLKLLMAPRKQNRFASSKDAFYAVDKKDSNIFLSLAQTQQRPHRRNFYATAAGISLILATSLYLLLKDQAGTRPTVSTIKPSDSISSISVSVKEPERSSSAPAFKPSESLNPPAIGGQEQTRPALTMPVAPDSGTVLLTSTPWAKVYVDNNFIGETPISKPLVLAVGKHTVMFMHPSFEPIIQTITVIPFREVSVVGNFIENAGYLNCVATPWAEVYINDQYKDTTPLEKLIVLSPGSYRIRFKNASFADITREVTVHPKDTVSVVVAFKEQR